jgi:acetyl esterase/lipase
MTEDNLEMSPPPADARIAYGRDPNQFLDLRLPPAEQQASARRKDHRPYPLVINIHGGYWNALNSLDHAGPLCAALTAKGVATANLEYRRVGNDGGVWPGPFTDVCAAYGFLVRNSRRYKLDIERMIVMGHSAGAQLALCLAAHEPEVTLVVSLAGVVDMRRACQLHLGDDAVVAFLGGTPAEVPGNYREADPMQLTIPRARQWLIHGSADELVPPKFSRDYVAAKQNRVDGKKEDVHLFEIPGAGHFDVIDPNTTAWRSVEQTVLQILT